ncbi:helix-turn-helix transcriptional regulator [Terasakiella pusilla]|uniref:helix-turn-helix transcriptional regulator n=1 Tax=Terasakiella pusilla TaxID=64973 RepID=UPI003AA911A0
MTQSHSKSKKETSLASEDTELEKYIARIGEQIKVIRSRRGMIRKDLSRHSDVSERYLAQAETGKANISIALLWRIAHALDVEISDLLPESSARSINTTLLNFMRNLDLEDQKSAFAVLKDHFGEKIERGHGVALIGLRGAGKTRLGSLLADEFRVPFIRLGEVIEELAQMNIGELISLRGQSAFRRYEMQALEKVIQDHPTMVLEVGGSLVSQSDTFNLLLDSFYSVWLKASPEEHMQRVIDQGDMRPMAGNKEALEDLRLILGEREAEYKLANYTLDTSDRNITHCLSELVETTRPYLESST